ncbi:MAG: hypothetical protein IIZ75_01610 [Lachnospiraceae bacterium]|nr:hypothetical protein [Lachnospiraceae bacterium]
MRSKKRMLALMTGAILLIQCFVPYYQVSAAAAGETGELKDKVLTDLPEHWNLTELYADEAAFEADMKRVEELIPAIEAYRGTLNSAEGILKELEDPELLEIKAILNKAEMYSSFLNTLDPTDPLSAGVAGRFNEAEQKVSLAEAFIEPEIMEMPLEKRQEIFSDERLAPYAYSMKQYTDPDHVALSEEAGMVEALLETAINNESTYNVFDSVEIPRPSFTYPDGTEGSLTDDVFSQIMQSKDFDHEFRKEIFNLRNAMRQPYANTYASLLEGEMRKNLAEAQIRGYSSTLEAALEGADVEPEIYERIIEFSHSILPEIHKYYKARKEALGLDEMMICDLYQSVTDYVPKEVTYEEAVNTGREGITVWGDEYLETFDRIIESPHVDVYPSPTKTGGAFEELIGNETLPFVCLDFTGLETFITTIVHEMGHAVYSELSAENQNEYNNYPGIFTQEVASTANELMFHKDRIQKAATGEEKIFWMDQEIDLFLGTILRQCMYSEFEDYCYKTLESGNCLNSDDMAEKWVELVREYYGDSVTVYEDFGIDWARIPHMYYNYYVYQYATSLTYAASICALADEKGQEEIDAYLDFLKAGNTAAPSELLGIAGVDPLSDETYEEAAKFISELIDEYVKEVKQAASEKTEDTNAADSAADINEGKMDEGIEQMIAELYQYAVDLLGKILTVK